MTSIQAMNQAHAEPSWMTRLDSRNPSLTASESFYA